MLSFFNKNKRNTELFRLHQDGIGLEKVHARDDGDYFDHKTPSSENQRGTGTSLGVNIRGRFFSFAFFVIALITGIMIFRTAQLQIIHGDEYRITAENNRFRTQVILPKRAVVYDRNNEIIISNAPSLTLRMTIADLPEDPQTLSDMLFLVADLVHLQRTDLDLIIQENSDSLFDQITIKKDISHEQALRFMIEKERFPGFVVQMATKREYTSKAISLSHILGYTGKINVDEYLELKSEGYKRTEEIGKIGIEKTAETILRGVPGKRIIEVDAYGQIMNTLAEKPPVEGPALTLSIDLEFQKYIEERMLEALSEITSGKASVVALDPRNGEVYALVSLPSFDSNVFAGGVSSTIYNNLLNNPDRPLFNRSISGEYPSGSTFKPFVAVAALAEGIIHEHTTFLSTGGIGIGVWFFPDWKTGGHGLTDVRKAIAESVNTFFYIVGGGYQNTTGLGVSRITEYAQKFGFGSKTGIDLPNEQSGFLPSKEWKLEAKGERWYVGDTYHLAIGQGDLLATPLQLASSLSIIANGGEIWQPHLMKAVDGKAIEYKPELIDESLQGHLKIVREGMRQTITEGSARSLSALPIDIAGKTGTAQIGGDRNPHAWFTSFAPYQNPEIVLVILIEEASEGSAAAVPIARDIYSWWYENRTP